MSDILFPSGRMIGGNLDKLFPRVESDGKTPKIGRDGQPEMQCSVGYAIPKGAETQWQQTPWGAEIYKVGSAAHPNLVASPAFSWKITDGDSTLPNKRGKRPCDQTGYAGHWIIWFSQGWLPKRVNANGTVELPEGSIVPGFYIQVFGSVAGNKLVPNGTPGVYLNPIAIALVGEGDRIANDVDTTSVGFGQAPPPQGARPVTAAAPQFAPPPAAPQNAGTPLYTPPPGMPAVGIAGITPTPAGGTPGGYQYTPPLAPVDLNTVQPAPDFLNPPPPAPAAPVAPVKQMTAKAAGATYEQFTANGWTDEMLVREGYLVG
jgi:hypothetical protein